MKKIISMLLFFISMLLFCLPQTTLAQEGAVSQNPLVTPLERIPVIQTPDRFVNFLFLGLDHGYRANSTKAYKEDIQECHTDAVLLVSMNLDQHRLSLISLPRDSLTYVPGVKGVYKLNSAVNCAPTLEEGFEKTCGAVSWHLGGIEIHGYVAVDVPAMVALGDAIGGVDFDLDMSYGGEGRYYQEGFQHLDGQGIMDYVRARKNATKNSNDLGRNDRQRRMIQAVMTKIRKEPLVINQAVDAVLSGELNIFTNIKLADLASFGLALLGTNMNEAKTYGLDGKYRTFTFNFTFNDPETRQRVIKEVFGVDVPPLDYVSYNYSKWLLKDGFNAAKHLNVAQKLISYAQAQPLEEKEQEALKALEAAYTKASQTFEAASLSLKSRDTSQMNSARYAMRKKGDALVKLLDYPEKLVWSSNKYWYNDPMINQWVFNWH
ncbi:MAG: LCP family protein [Clostridia bacterium]|nr:LCP family protein [Clostridia bacterium]